VNFWLIIGLYGIAACLYWDALNDAIGVCETWWKFLGRIALAAVWPFPFVVGVFAITTAAIWKD
jgi:hypothetical protein